jgi:diaminopimelate epimerase
LLLTKHHGLGNDFLVRAGAGALPPADPALARAVCDRRLGVGADGLLHLGPADAGSGAEVAMVLLNADGGRAEMSGNGIACLAQAAVVRGLAAGPLVTVATDAGRRTVELHPTEAPRTHVAAVGMGAAAVGGDDLPAWAGGDVLRALRVSMGNPHLVLLAADAALLDDRDRVADLGRAANEATPGGVNVEVVAPGADGELRMDVYERGVGLTLACGTGACAAAVAARRWDLAGDRVAVRMRGGTATVDLAGREIRMTVPVAYVADVEYHES